MKSPDNSQLDNFIREALKTPEHNLPSVDWSEVEVLLKHETKSISLPEKKYLFLGAGAIVFLAGIFFLVKFITSPSSNSFNSADITVDTTTLLPSVDSGLQKTVALPADTIKTMDTITQIAKVAIADTISTTKPEQIAEGKTGEKKTEEKKITSVEPEKTENKNTPISLLKPTISDTSFAPENILPPDTAGKSNSTAIKIDSSVFVDSPVFIESSKVDTLKKNKKGKKEKPPVDTAKVKTETLPQVNPDSLK